MRVYFSRYFLILGVLLLSSQVFAQGGSSWFMGFSSGYGSTTWSQLVSNDSLMNVNVPIKASEGGAAWSVMFGNQVSKNFALQLQYIHVPKASFVLGAFNADSKLPIPSNRDPTVIRTKTKVLDLLAKFIVPVRSIKGVDVFADIGVSYTRREDILNRGKNIGAVFGAGVDYVLSDRWAVTGNALVNTGYGKSEKYPADDYIPFVYTVQLGMDYYFSIA